MYDFKLLVNTGYLYMANVTAVHFVYSGIFVEFNLNEISKAMHRSCFISLTQAIIITEQLPLDPQNPLLLNF